VDVQRATGRLQSRERRDPERDAESLREQLQSIGADDAFSDGEAALAACPEISELDLAMPNKHCLLINLAPFGLENNNELFVPTDEPHGDIRAIVMRMRDGRCAPAFRGSYRSRNDGSVPRAAGSKMFVHADGKTSERSVAGSSKRS